MLASSSRALAEGAAQRLLGSLAVTSAAGHWPAHTPGTTMQAGTDTLQARCYSAAGTSTSGSKLPPYSPTPGPKAPGRRTARSPDAWRARVNPDAGRYGVHLRQRDPEAFERMRLMLGFYDLRENSHLPRPRPPKRVTVSNLQALRFLHDVDPYYRLALLSYRTRGLNAEVMARMGDTQRFLDGLASEAGREFVPAISGAAGHGGRTGSVAAGADADSKQQ